MKITIVTTALVLLASTMFAQVLIPNSTVEVYYETDAADEAYSEDADPVPPGSVTYRVFVEICEGCKLRSLYGDENHPFLIQSTEVFFNNSDRGDVWGHTIGDNRPDDNTVALDTWLSFGAGTDEHWAVLKAQDTDGSFIAGDDNSDGLLVNETEAMVIPLTLADGLILNEDGTTEPENFFASIALGDALEEFFGETTTTSTMFLAEEVLATSGGIELPQFDNRILVAQLTTAGELEFTLNVEIENPDGEIISVVGTNDTLLEGEIFSPYLSYPPECGCTDPDYLEYDAGALCDDGSCSTLVIFGCGDPEACNYDPEVNLSIEELCCFWPDNCEGLDVDILCPGVGIEELSGVEISIYPNPNSGTLFIDLPKSTSSVSTILLYDNSGRIVKSVSTPPLSQGTQLVLDLEGLETGQYLVQIIGPDISAKSRLIKH